MVIILIRVNPRHPCLKAKGIIFLTLSLSLLLLAAISLVQSFDDFARDVVGGIAIEQVVKSGIAQDEVILLLGIVNLDEVVD